MPNGHLLVDKLKITVSKSPHDDAQSTVTEAPEQLENVKTKRSGK
jgi:hypothetical protein